MNAEMKQYLRPAYHLIKYFIPFFIFSVKLIARRRREIPTKNKFRGRIFVLANGLSLKGVISQLSDRGRFAGCDYFVMKLFALESQFLKIKPKHYCFADPMFYQDTDTVKLKPIVDTITGNGSVKIATYLSGLAVMFRSHDQLQSFSLYKNSRVTNMTKGSMIDSYPRGAQ